MSNKKIAWIAMLTALSAVGAAIKVPAIIGSVALDSFPALLAAALLGGPAGAAAGGLGHLLSALFGGMPLGPLHFLVAMEMALLAFLYSHLYRKGRRWLASLLFIAGNSIAAPVPFMFILGEAFYLAIVPSLLLGSTLNAVLAFVVIPKIARIVENTLLKKGIYW